MTKNYTRILAEYLAGLKFEDLPEDVVDMAKKVVLDYIGYAIVAIKEEPAQILYEIVKGLGGKAESTVIGFGGKTSCINAALVNGALGHTCELDDSHRGCRGHIGDSVIPAALAFAEREKSDGRSFIVALAAGYETASRVGKSVMPTHYLKGYHPTGTVNTFGAAVAAGKLLDLNTEGMVHALGIAGTQAAGIFAFIENRDMTKDFHPGKAAMNGGLAALLAQGDFTGSSRIFESEKGFCKIYSDGYDLEKLTKGLGKGFELMEVQFKPYSGCRGGLAGVCAILELREKHNLSKDNVKKITVRLFPICYWLVNDPSPWGKGYYGPRFSMQFNAAFTLEEGKPGLMRIIADENYALKKLEDPEFKDLMKKVEVVSDKTLESDWHDKESTIVEIETIDGENYSTCMDYCLGDPENPMSWEQLYEKYQILASRILSKDKVEKIIQKVKRLEKMDDISELTMLLFP